MDTKEASKKAYNQWLSQTISNGISYPSSYEIWEAGRNYQVSKTKKFVTYFNHDKSIVPLSFSRFNTLQEILDEMKIRKHEIFEQDDKPFNLNIVGIRSPSPILDTYGCKLTCFWKYKGNWEFRIWPGTTLPGSTYLIKKLLNPKGAAILVPGQYNSVYALDLHGGRYEALCQRNGTVKVYRDGDRDKEFDFNPKSITQGFYGINIHAPITPQNGYKNYVADKVYQASAGCQVFQKMADFLEFRDICRSARTRWGNTFTYTLL